MCHLNLKHFIYQIGPCVYEPSHACFVRIIILSFKNDTTDIFGFPIQVYNSNVRTPHSDILQIRKLMNVNTKDTNKIENATLINCVCFRETHRTKLRTHALCSLGRRCVNSLSYKGHYVKMEMKHKMVVPTAWNWKDSFHILYLCHLQFWLASLSF